MEMMSRLFAFLDKYEYDNPKYLALKEEMLRKHYEKIDEKQGKDVTRTERKEMAKQTGRYVEYQAMYDGAYSVDQLRAIKMQEEIDAGKNRALVEIKHRTKSVSRVVGGVVASFLVLGLTISQGAAVAKIYSRAKEIEANGGEEVVEKYNEGVENIVEELRAAGVDERNPVELCKAIEFFLWGKGIDNNPLTYSYDMQYDMSALLGFDVIENQNGVCRNFAALGADVLEAMGYEADYYTTITMNKENYQLPDNLERKVDLDSLNSTFQSKESEKENDDSSKHAIVRIKLSDGKVIFWDPTNLGMGYYKDGYIDVNGSKTNQYDFDNQLWRDNFGTAVKYMIDDRFQDEIGNVIDPEILSVENQEKYIQSAREKFVLLGKQRRSEGLVNTDNSKLVATIRGENTPSSRAVENREAEEYYRNTRTAQADMER